MKNKLLFLLPFVLASCSGPTNFTGEIKKAKKLDDIFLLTAKDKSSLNSFKDKYNNFAFDFMSQYFHKENKGSNNVLLSPLTVYEVLNFAKECANENTKAEIDNLINGCGDISQDTFIKAFNYDKILSYPDMPEQYQLTQILDNSIWIDSGVSYKQECINHLSNDYYVSSFKTDFKNNPKESSEQINEYCYKNTNGFLNPGFSFNEQTCFALLSSYYLKALWNENGNELPLTIDEYSFINNDKTIKRTKLNYYSNIERKIFSNAQCSSFVISDTTNNVDCYFVVPNDNYSVNEVMNKNNLIDVLSYDYSNHKEDKYLYKTSCLFPSFTIENNVSIQNEIENLGIHDLFSSNCNFTNLTDECVYCNDITHVNKLDVGRKGIEGASITTITLYGSPYVEETREIIHQDFIVDKAFGFVITSMNIPTFIGIVNSIE